MNGMFFSVDHSADASELRRLWIICLARMVIASILAISLSIVAYSADSKQQATLAPHIIAMAYSLVSLAAIWVLAFATIHWRGQLFAQLMADILLVGLLVSSLGGSAGGYVILLAMPIAFAASLLALDTALLVCSIAVFILFFDTARHGFLDKPESDWFLLGLQGVFGFGLALMLHWAAKATTQREQMARQQLLRDQLTREIDEQHLSVETQGWLVVDAQHTVQMLNAPARRMAWQAGVLLEVGSNLATLPALVTWFNALNTTDEVGAPWPPVVTTPPHNNAQHLFIKAAKLSHFQTHTALHLELSAARQDKQRQLQLAAMGRLSASIAHEIRNPLAAISQAAELLVESDTLTAPDTPMVQMMLSNVQRIDRIVHHLLSWSRGIQATPVVLDYTQHVLAVAQTIGLGLRLPLGVLHIDPVPEGLKSARFDPDHLYQIVSNVLSNASRFASGAAASIRITLKPRGDFVALWVQDDGAAVDALVAEHLFEPFQSGSHQGTGLGLFLCREYAQANRSSFELVQFDPASAQANKDALPAAQPTTQPTIQTPNYTKAFVLNINALGTA